MSSKKIYGEISEARGHSYLIDWTIPDYYAVIENQPIRDNVDGNGIESPRFRFRNATWNMEIWDEGAGTDLPLWSIIGVYFCSEALAPCEDVISASLGVKTKTNQRKVYCIGTASGKYVLIPGSGCIIEGVRVEWGKDFTLEDGAVTFFCLLRIVNNEQISSLTQTPAFEDFRFLSRDLKKLLRSEKDADVTIKVQDQEYRAHSQILSARSPVFAPMTRHDMKEKITGVIEIAEYDPETFRELLSFLYSGQPGKLSSDNVIDLYCAAEKYDVQQLKTGCTEFITDELSEDNFIDVFSLAVQYEDKELMGCLTEFFLKQQNKILGTDKWLSFTKDFPKQSSELMSKIEKELIP